MKLRAIGLRITLPRLSVLSVLAESPQQWMDANTVFQQVVARGAFMRLSVVYHVMQELECRGLVLREWRNGIRGHKAIYKLNSIETPVHEHTMVCRQCGVGISIDAPDLPNKLRKLARTQGLVLASQPMVIHVICDQCTPEGG